MSNLDNKFIEANPVRSKFTATSKDLFLVSKVKNQQKGCNKIEK